MSDFTIEFAADQAIDEQTFIDFIRILIKDRYKKLEGSSDFDKQWFEKYDPWKNLTTDDFLQALIIWTEGTKDSSENYQKPDNLWTRFAHMVLLAITQPYK
jgi:hypothetical protein